MARKAPAAVDTTRRLAERQADGSTGKLHNGAVYVRGMEDQLPKDFPMDGPHWEDYEPDADEAAEPKGLAAQHAAAKQQAMGASPEMGVDMGTAVNEVMPGNQYVAAPVRAGSKKRTKKRSGGRGY